MVVSCQGWLVRRGTWRTESGAFAPVRRLVTPLELFPHPADIRGQFAEPNPQLFFERHAYNRSVRTETLPISRSSLFEAGTVPQRKVAESQRLDPPAVILLTVPRPRRSTMPPRGVTSSKRARQYEHIKESAQKQGRSTARAKQIAAATVNKQRSEAGETKKAKSSTAKKKSTATAKKKSTGRSSQGTKKR